MADESKLQQNNFPINPDTSDPKMQKSNPKSSFSLKNLFWWGKESETSKDVTPPVPPPGATTNTPQINITVPPPVPVQNTSKPIIQHMTNYSDLRVYLGVFYSYTDENGKNQQKKGFLHSSHVIEINTARSTIWGSSGLNANVSLHSHYLICEKPDLDPISVPFVDVFRMGNIMDVVVFTKVKYSIYDKPDDIKFEPKIFLIQRGAFSGFRTSINGTGNSVLSLTMESIDLYSNRTKVYITPISDWTKEAKVNGTSTEELIKKARKNLDGKKQAVSRIRNPMLRRDKIKQIDKEIEKLDIQKDKIGSNSSVEFVGRVLSLIQEIVNIKTEKTRGKLAMEVIYSYIASSFKVSYQQNDPIQVIAKLIDDYQIMGFIHEKGKLPKIMEKVLIGVLAGDNDYFFDSTYGGAKKVFDALIANLKNKDNKEYSFSEIIPTLGLKFFHEIYYDPFVELESIDKNPNLLKSNEQSAFNKVFVYSDVKIENYYFEEITKPSFVLRHKPFATMFSLKKKEKEIDLDSKPNGGGNHIYHIAPESIISISINADMSQIKTAISFGGDFNYIIPPEKVFDVIIFGSNILYIENLGWLTNIQDFAKTDLFTIAKYISIGSDSYFGSATITSIYSPVRAGCIARIPYMINEKEEFVYGYIASVKDSFSSSGEALTTLEIQYLDSSAMRIMMGVDNEDGETAPNLMKESATETISKSIPSKNAVKTS